MPTYWRLSSAISANATTTSERPTLRSRARARRTAERPAAIARGSTFKPVRKKRRWAAAPGVVGRAP